MKENKAEYTEQERSEARHKEPHILSIEEISAEIASEKYSFLRENEHLGSHIAMIGLGGSYAYGTNKATSDLDVRGFALNSKEDILGGGNFEQFEEHDTDTVIYGFTKFVRLLAGCNPNMIEILGLKPEHYIYLSPVGKELLDNRKMFLSRQVVHTFGGYASSQLRRLDNKSGRIGNQAIQEQHLLNSILKDLENFGETYANFPEDAINLYLDSAVNPEFEREIFMDISLKHYPIRDYKDMLSRIAGIVRDYNAVGKRNKQALTHDKIGKHSMHLLRLYMMCIDILEKGEIVTYREKEHDLLMSIRNNEYLDKDGQPIPEFFEMVDEYEKRMKYAAENTDLPAKPDHKRINEFVMSVNEKVVKGEI